MAEDLIMEFEEAPAEPAATLATARALARTIETQLISIITGLIQRTGWMRPTRQA